MTTTEPAHRFELATKHRSPGGDAVSHRVDVRTAERMLLTVDEAAKRLGIGRSTMYTLMAKGEVASIHVGRLRRIEPAALSDYIARCRGLR